MKEKEMEMVANWMIRVIGEIKKCQLPESKEERKPYIVSFEKDMAHNSVVLKVKEEIEKLCLQFPLPY